MQECLLHDDHEKKYVHSNSLPARIIEASVVEIRHRQLSSRYFHHSSQMGDTFRRFGFHLDNSTWPTVCSFRINNVIMNKRFNSVNGSVVFACHSLGQQLVYEIFSKRSNKRRSCPLMAPLSCPILTCPVRVRKYLAWVTMNRTRLISVCIEAWNLSREEKCWRRWSSKCLRKFSTFTWRKSHAK